MEIASRVQDLGYAVLGPAFDLKSATALVAERTPTAALLDVQLGRDRVTPLARDLLNRDVPFALVTGYARLTLHEEEFKEAPRLSKPITQPELERVLARMADPG